jgi:hypothetical protein
MSEQHPLLEQGAEHLLSPENKVEHTGAKADHERELTQSERQHGNDVEHHRAKVEQHAITTSEHASRVAEHHPVQNKHPLLASLELKTAAWNRVMTRTRKKLSLPDKVFSRVIHNNAIDATSEFVGKTVARPSGVLFGAVLAFIGTSGLLWATKHYGYEYNYLAVMLLFAGGMVLGLGLEGVWRLLKKR